MIRLRYALLLLFCCVACLTCPKDDTPAWENISESTGDSFTPAVAVDENGGVFVVWTDKTSGNNEILFAEKSATGIWTEGINISSSPSLDASAFIDVDSQGDIHICWWGIESNTPDTRIMYRCRDASGVWDTIQVLAEPDTGESTYNLPRIIVDSNNNVFVMWETFGTLQYMHKPPAGDWSDVMAVPNSSARNPAQLTADKYGNLHIVWEGGSNNIKYQMRTPDGSWQDYTVISDSALPLIPDIAVDNTGVVHITWSALDDNHIRYVHYTNNESGSWSEAQLLPRLSDRDIGTYNSIAAHDGTAYIVWENETENPDGSYQNSEIYYVKRYADGTWSNIYNVSNTEGRSICEVSSIAVDGDGNAHIVWADNEPGNFDAFYIMIPADSLD